MSCSRSRSRTFLQNMKRKRLIQEDRSDHTEELLSPLDEFRYEGDSKIQDAIKEYEKDKEHLKKSLNSQKKSVQKQSIQKQSVQKQATLTSYFSQASSQKRKDLERPVRKEKEQEEEDYQMALRLQQKFEEEQEMRQFSQEFQKQTQIERKKMEVEVPKKVEVAKKGFAASWRKPEKEKEKSAEKEKKRGKQQQEVVDGPLRGHTIVFTGILNVCSREALSEFLRRSGAKITGSVSGKTTELIAGDKLEDTRPCEEGNKYKSALQQQGKKNSKLRILREHELDTWLMEVLGVSLDEIGGSGPLEKISSILVGSEQAHSDQWTSKYSPRCLRDFVGNHRAVQDFHEWLANFGTPKQANSQKKHFTMMQLGRFQLAGNADSKACLISGPPGIGKSTMVNLVCQLMGYKVVHNNASDQRNKANINNHVSHLADNQLISNGKLHSKTVILMDEVDGMTGSDRGGLQALVGVIKSSKVPVVCICNERESMKLRTLVSHCNPIRLVAPAKELVLKRVRQICREEKWDADTQHLERIIEMLNCDIRSILNFVQLYRRDPRVLHDDEGKGKGDLNTFEAACILLDREKRSKLKLRQKLDLFFVDYDLIPLIVQDSYLQATKKDTLTLRELSKAAECIAESDILNRQIRLNQNWALMPFQGFMSSVYPCECVAEKVGFPKFPEFLGMSSKLRKQRRELREVKWAINHRVYNVSLRSIGLEYAPVLLSHLVHTLADASRTSICHAIQLLDHYGLTLDHFKEHLTDVQFNPKNQTNYLAALTTQCKTQLTRLYNQRHSILKELKNRKKQPKLEYHKDENYDPAIGEENAMLSQDIVAEILDDDEKDQQVKLKKKENKEKKKKDKKKKKDEDDQIDDSMDEFIVQD